MIGRIRDRATFAGFTRGRRAACGPVRLRFVAAGAEAAVAPEARVAYAVNRKVGNAVVRNRIRRRIRAALVELDRSNHEGLPGGDYLFTADASLAELPFPEVQRIVSCVVRRASRHG